MRCWDGAAAAVSSGEAEAARCAGVVDCGDGAGDCGGDAAEAGAALVYRGRGKHDGAYRHHPGDGGDSGATAGFFGRGGRARQSSG